MSSSIELWFWELKDELTGKWRRTSWRMTEEDARTRHGDNARKVEGTLELRGGDPRRQSINLNTRPCSQK